MFLVMLLLPNTEDDQKETNVFGKIWYILQSRANGYQINSLTFEIRHSEYRVKFPFFFSTGYQRRKKINGNLNMAERI